MSSVLSPVVPHLKAFHIAMLVVWCGGLLALPGMLARHDPTIGQDHYTRIRRTSHYGYIFLVTPAALFTIGSGTALVLALQVFTPWLYAKLVVVALLVLFHAWVGHEVVAVVDKEVEAAPRAWLPMLVLLGTVLSILALVLGKPDLGALPLPDWLREPRGQELPFNVPRR